MLLPQAFTVDFSSHRKDLVAQALARLLSQHWDKCILRQFVSVFVAEAQRALDACVDLQQMRTIAVAQGENLDAIGRIVGEHRESLIHDTNRWMFFDRAQQGFDHVFIWTETASLLTPARLADEQYRTFILQKVLKNHVLMASLPEVTALTRQLLGINVSFIRVSANQVDAVIPATALVLHVELLIKNVSNSLMDRVHFFPYPATASLRNVIFAPSAFFSFDMTTRGFDSGSLSVGLSAQ